MEERYPNGRKKYERDYSAENKKEMEHKTFFAAKIDKKLGNAFKEKLEKDNVSFSDWLRIKIKEYLKIS